MDADTKILLKRYIDITFRRKWWILVPLTLSLGAAPLVFKHVPKTYRAETTILVKPQSLSQRVAESTVTGRTEDRLASLSVQIKSRTYLERIVKEVGLVDADATPEDLEKASQSLSKRVELEHDPENVSWFTVVTLDVLPERAALIANRLADMFISENTQWREERAQEATRTVDDWLQKKKEQLDAEEKKVAAYREKHIFELPQQLPANLQLHSAAQNRLTSIENDLRSREDMLALLNTQHQAESTLDPLETPTRNLDPITARLVALQNELSELRVRYTDENPAVRTKLAEIQEYRKLHPGLSAAADPDAAPTGLAADMTRVRQEIENLKAQRDQILRDITMYTQRINRTPIREQELAALTRDYDMLQSEYNELLRKREFTGRGEDLETAQQGEQFRVQDRARVPNSPYKPQFGEILILCLIMGLGVGVGLTALLEFIDQTFRNEDEFRQAFPGVPVLVSIPKLDTGGTAKGKWGRRGRDAATILAVSVMTGVQAFVGWFA